MMVLSASSFSGADGGTRRTSVSHPYTSASGGLGPPRCALPEACDARWRRCQDHYGRWPAGQSHREQPRSFRGRAGRSIHGQKLRSARVRAARDVSLRRARCVRPSRSPSLDRRPVDGYSYGRRSGGELPQIVNLLLAMLKPTLQDCLRKLQVAQKLRKGGWRDKAGVAGCKECAASNCSGSTELDLDRHLSAQLRRVSRNR